MISLSFPLCLISGIFFFAWHDYIAALFVCLFFFDQVDTTALDVSLI